MQSWAIRNGLSTTFTSNLTALDTVIYTYGTGSDTGLVTHVFDTNIGHDWPSTEPNVSHHSRSMKTMDRTTISFFSFWKDDEISLYLSPQLQEMINFDRQNLANKSSQADNSESGHHVASFNASSVIMEFFGQYTLPSTADSSAPLMVLGKSILGTNAIPSTSS